MKFKYKLVLAATVLTLSFPFIDGNVWLFALQQPRQQQPVQQSQPAVEKQKAESEPKQKNTALAREVRNLTKEIRQLNAQQRQILDLLFLKIEQERVNRSSDKFAGIEAQLRILASRERQLDFKLKNIDTELLTRNILNRSDAERTIKAEVENEREEIKQERNRLELERQRLRDDINVSNRQLELIRTRLITGLSNDTTSKAIVDYLQDQDQLIPIESDPSLTKDDER